MKSIAVGSGVIVALAVLSVALLGGVAADTPTPEDDTDRAEFGAEVSSFMHASSAEAEGDVSDGMFRSAVDRAETAEERRALVERRERQLLERQQRLEQRRDVVDSQRRGVADFAIAAHVNAGAASLERSAAGTERVAAEVGVDVDRLATIRENASEMRGHETAQLARSLAGGPSEAGSRPAEPPGLNRSDERPGAGSGGPDASGDAGPPDGDPSADDTGTDDDAETETTSSDDDASTDDGDTDDDELRTEDEDDDDSETSDGEE